MGRRYAKKKVPGEKKNGKMNRETLKPITNQTSENIFF